MPVGQAVPPVLLVLEGERDRGEVSRAHGVHQLLLNRVVVAEGQETWFEFVPACCCQHREAGSCHDLDELVELVLREVDDVVGKAAAQEDLGDAVEEEEVVEIH